MTDPDTTALVAAIEQGLADTRASRIVSSQAMVRDARTALGVAAADATATAGSGWPVVWTVTAHARYLATLAAITDAKAAIQVADRLDQTAGTIDAMAAGTPGKVDFTYEAPVAGLPYVLAYEIVTWQKAGDVVAILDIIPVPPTVSSAGHASNA